MSMFGLDGGGAGNSATSNTTTTETTNYSQGAQDEGVNALNSTVTINKLDGGVFDFASDVVADAMDAIAASLDFSETSSRAALDFAFDAGRPEAAISQKMIYVAGAVAVALVLVSFGQGKKGKSKK